MEKAETQMKNDTIHGYILAETEAFGRQHIIVRCCRANCAGNKHTRRHLTEVAKPRKKVK